MEGDIDELTKRKLLEFQQKQQVELQKRSVLMEILTPEARSRLANVKVARPAYGASIENMLVQLAYNGQIKQKINEEQLKQILVNIAGKKKEFRIRRI